MAMLFEDYLKLRNAKIGEMVVLSTGESMEKESSGDIHIGRVTKPSKNSNLDNYDRTYIG